MPFRATCSAMLLSFICYQHSSLCRECDDSITTVFRLTALAASCCSGWCDGLYCSDPAANACSRCAYHHRCPVMAFSVVACSFAALCLSLEMVLLFPSISSAWTLDADRGFQGANRVCSARIWHVAEHALRCCFRADCFAPTHSSEQWRQCGK